MIFFYRSLMREIRSGIFVVIFLAACAFPAALSGAAEIPEVKKEIQPLPPALGEVVFERAGNGKGHIFIIGHSHRSSLTGENGKNTVRTQMEVYRIGEWLIRNEHVELLLPEGFFRRKPDAPVPAEITRTRIDTAIEVENQFIEEALSDTSIFINADILLRDHFGVRLQQVENQEIYRAVGEYLGSIDRQGEYPAFFQMELNYMQEVRSAAMLQRIPEVIDREFQDGSIDDRKAILTIGMAHIDEIIRFLKDGKVHVTPPVLSSAAYGDFSAAVKLVEEGYGVTVILPKALIDDTEALMLANLHEI